MAHGISLIQRYARGPVPLVVHEHDRVGTAVFSRVVGTTYTNPAKDRRLPGKARRRARKAARR